MKRSLSVDSALCFCMGLLFVSGIPAVHAAPILSLAPVSSSINVGESFEQRIWISGLLTGTSLTAPSLSGYDITLTFDSTALSPGSFVFGDPSLGNQLNLGGFGTFAFETPGIGSLNLFELSVDDPTLLDTTQADAFELGRLQFQALAPGTWNVVLTVNSLSDSLGNPLAYSTDVSSASVQVAGSNVPEPITVLTVGSSLALLAVVRRRDHKS